MFQRYRAQPRGDWPAWLKARAQSSHYQPLQAFYAGCSIPPDQPIGETELVALDCETSGLDARRHDILSIGLMPFNLDGIKVAQRQHWLLRPPRGLTEASVAYHHITHSDTEQAPDFAAVLPTLLSQLTGKLVVVHYHPIEREFLDQAVRYRLNEPWRFPVIDTMAIEARRYRHHWRARLRQAIGLAPISIRLNDSRARYGLPAYSGHQAVLDAIATAELLQAQIQHHYSRSTPVSALWV